MTVYYAQLWQHKPEGSYTTPKQFIKKEKKKRKRSGAHPRVSASYSNPSFQKNPRFPMQSLSVQKVARPIPEGRGRKGGEEEGFHRSCVPVAEGERGFCLFFVFCFFANFVKFSEFFFGGGRKGK